VSDDDDCADVQVGRRRFGEMCGWVKENESKRSINVVVSGERKEK
jgi:hypothetical protein